MTFSVLAKGPKDNFYSTHFLDLLHEGPGRIFVATGNLSKVTPGTRSIFTELLNWTIKEPSRHLDLLVGVYDFNGELNTETVAEYLADQIKAAIPITNPRIKISARFFAVPKWHAKAAGRTGLGNKFHQVEKLLVGSTNISDSAMFGSNFELDIYITNTPPGDESLLKAYIDPLANLIRVGVRQYRVEGFHDTLQKKVFDHVEFVKVHVPGGKDDSWILEAQPTPPQT